MHGPMNVKLADFHKITLSNQISGFRREVDECALLASTKRVAVIPSRRFGTNYLSRQGSRTQEVSRVLNS